MALLLAFGNITMPFELPTAVFASTRLLFPMTPRPKSTAGPVAYPLPLVSFHRNELLLPWIHMPPHAAAAAPFRTETLLSTLMPDEVGLMRMPDMQFVVVVTPCTQPLAVPKNRMPSPWNRWTTPGPRTPTLLWPLVLTPVSVPTLVPLQPVAASFGPVLVKPFRFSAMFGAPNAIHGAPVTLQVTSA